MCRITDDTQMTLFTAEGLLRAWVRQSTKGICHPPSVIHHAYLRWLLTQGERPEGIDVGCESWLYSVSALHARRAPGLTCLSALRAARGFGEPAVAQNSSKGCGGVMRVAPIGLLASRLGGHDRVFGLAADVAALTHGHPTGQLSAGFLAVAVAALTRGDTLADALDAAVEELRRRERKAETLEAVIAARALAGEGRPGVEDIERLGEGWIAEEALAIAVCCSLAARDFADGLQMATNHSGDSDSTAAITGHLLGTLLGEDAIPSCWLDKLELRSEISRLAEDLHRAASGQWDAEDAWESYPGW
jgi:ADP-ribosylglycohydrolase